jgi:DNA-binding response OmpR family regulator
MAIRNSAQWQNLPVVMTSAIDYSRVCREAGATDFIVKPFNWEDVTRRIRIILGASA